MADMLGSVVELDVTTLAHGGVGVARLDGRVVFVSDAIPGERVRARIAEDRKKSFWRADTVEVLEPSPHRRPHVWSAAAIDRDPDERAGGAELGHIDLAHQRELKAGVLADALRRFAHLERDVVVAPLPGDDGAASDGAAPAPGTRWRTRVRLHADARGRLGPYASRSHTVVPVRDLPLATEAVERAALAEPLPASLADGDAVEVVQHGDGAVRVLPGTAPRRVIERVHGVELAVDDTGFWQVHRAAPTALWDAVVAAATADVPGAAPLDPDAHHLDLYGGVGLLATALASATGPGIRITSVESDARASGHARANLERMRRAEATTGRVERFLVRLLTDAGAPEREALHRGTVVLDPPRAGAGAAVVDALDELDPARIVYVACDPVALARDTGALAERGWRLDDLAAFDLFPNTHHLEAVASFTRASRDVRPA